MKEILSTHNIYVKKVALEENRKDFTIGYLPDFLEDSKLDIQGMNLITCNNGFEYLVELLVNLRLDPTAARTKHNLLSEYIQCVLICYDGNPFGISVADSNNCFVFNRGEILSKEDVKCIVKTQKRQALYSKLENYNKKTQIILKELSELENLELDF